MVRVYFRRFPFILANFNLSDMKPMEVEEAMDKIIARYSERYDAVGKLKAEEVNFENCIKVRDKTSQNVHS